MIFVQLWILFVAVVYLSSLLKITSEMYVVLIIARRFVYKSDLVLQQQLTCCFLYQQLAQQ